MLSLLGFLSSAHLIDSIHAIKHFQANWFSATFSLENTHWTIYWKDIQKHINHLCVFYFPSRVVPFVIPASKCLLLRVCCYLHAGQKPTVSYFSCRVRWNIPKCGYCIKFLKSLTAVLNILRFCGDLTGLFSVIMFAFC